MKSKTKKARFFINYILGPVYVLVMFRITFFEDHESFTEKVIAHKSDPKLYIAIALAAIFLIFFRRGMKFPKDINK